MPAIYESGSTPESLAAAAAAAPLSDDGRGGSSGSAAPSNLDAPGAGAASGPSLPPSSLPSSASAPVSTTDKQVQEVLASEIGVPAMLHRLKQSVTSAKEFAHFLRKRATLEEEYAHGMRKLCRLTQEAMHRPEHREGTFLSACDDMMAIHERMADNGLQFASCLYQMHNDLNELSDMAERHRKGWKATGMAAEERVAEVEQATRKSKAKYDALAEEYDRARTGDARPGGKMSLFKMSKSLAQQEEDLLRKVQGADQFYYGQVLTLQSERSKLTNTTRPETVKALLELVKETDAVMALQLAKFASFNEKLLLSNGLAISPLQNADVEPSAQPRPRSLRHVVSVISNDRDLTTYILAHHPRLMPNQGSAKYEKHPVGAAAQAVTAGLWETATDISPTRSWQAPFLLRRDPRIRHSLSPPRRQASQTATKALPSATRSPGRPRTVRRSPASSTQWGHLHLHQRGGRRRPPVSSTEARRGQPCWAHRSSGLHQRCSSSRCSSSTTTTTVAA